MGDVEVLSQLISSMLDAVDKLEAAEKEGRKGDFEKIRFFLLDMQRRVKLELMR